jgi:hypothetical protein
MEEMIKYRVLNLSKLDVKGIMAQKPDADVAIEEPKKDPQRHNELATLALSGGFVLLGMAAAFYFGKKSSEEIDLIVEEIKPNGSTRKVSLKLRKSSTEPVESQILEGLKAVEQGS